MEYEVYYLPPGISDPSLGQSGVVSPATGSVQLPAGDTSANVSVEIYDNAFLDIGKMYVELNATSLNGGGML